MDNNKPITPQPAAQAPPQPSPNTVPNTIPNPAPPSATPAGTSPPQGSKKKIFLIIGAVIIIILIAGGIFWYLNRQGTKTPAQQTVSKATPSPTPTETVDTIDKELNSVDVESAGSDFTSVDADLENL